MRFLNGDPTAHNVFSPDFEKYDLGTWPQGQTKDYAFAACAKPPCAYTQLCKIHPQMDAYIVVLQNPCFAVTDKGGRYEIDNVPPGSYTLSAWYARHRQIGLSGWRAYIQMMRLGLLVLALGSILSAPASAQSALAAQGEKVFAAKKCSVCHLVGGVGNKKGQTLDGVGSKLAAEEIRQWITNAPEMAAKANITRKPPMKAYTDFSKEEVDALVAYVATLKK